MAFYFASPLLLALILLTSPFISIIFADGSLVETICPETTDPCLCIGALQQDTRSEQADLPTLCQVSIDMARSYAETSFDMIDIISQHVTDPRAKSAYKINSEMYKEAIQAFDNTTQLLKSGDYFNLTGIASTMRLNIDLFDGILELTPDLPEVGVVIESNRRLYALADIIMVIGRNLILHLKG